MPKQTAKQQVDQILNRSRPRPDLRAMLAVADGEVVEPSLLAIDLLADNPYQPRKVMDSVELQSLAGVIREQGFQGVLVARPHPERPGWYQLAFGHRRRDASRLAGLTTLPVLVRDLSNTQMIVLAVTENVQRADLTPLEEGDIFRLMIEKLGYTQERIAGEIGKNRGYVVNRLRAARSSNDVRALVEEKPDSLRAVPELLKIEDEGLRAQTIEDLRAGRITSDDLVKAVSVARLVSSDEGTAAEQDSEPAATQGRNTRRGAIRRAEATGETPEGVHLVGGSDDHPTAGRNGANANVLSREQIRSRRGKAQLGRAVRVLQEFVEESKDREDISAPEIIELHELEQLVEEAVSRWRPAAIAR